MASKQHHRGQHPDDALQFGEKAVPKLRAAVRDLSWLYTRGYAETAALKLVGDHYQLTLRQRTAIQRASCGDADLAGRRSRSIPRENIAGARLAVDGYNVLITVESALSGGFLIQARDGCLRDMASLHGSYRRVEETLPAIRRIGEALASLRPAMVQWYFDAPISNSGRLRALIIQEAEAHLWPWRIDLLPNPDPVLAATQDIVVTSDSAILDRVARWANLAGWVIAGFDPRPRIIDLAAGP